MRWENLERKQVPKGWWNGRSIQLKVGKSESRQAQATIIKRIDIIYKNKGKL